MARPLLAWVETFTSQPKVTGEQMMSPVGV